MSFMILKRGVVMETKREMREGRRGIREGGWRGRLIDGW